MMAIVCQNTRRVLIAAKLERIGITRELIVAIPHVSDPAYQHHEGDSDQDGVHIVAWLAAGATSFSHDEKLQRA